MGPVELASCSFGQSSKVSYLQMLTAVCAVVNGGMCKLMEGVVTKGTGTRAAVPGYRVGGKSGTSQKLDSKNEGARIASFVAVAPIEAPRLAVLICLDEPHSWTTSGGALSGPVCAEILQKALPYLGIEPTEMVEK